MLKSDIFFLYPAGYCGNYLQWVINKSEEATANKTIDNPLLDDDTTHGFVRRPTHTVATDIVSWIIRHNQVTPQTYVVNCWEVPKQRAPRGFLYNALAASLFLNSRPNGVCVNIHATNIDEIKYGALNTYVKWPTFFASCFYDVSFKIFGADQPMVDLTDRNIFVNSWRDDFPVNPPFDWKFFADCIETSNKWFRIRNSLQPWEINEEEFVLWETVPDDRVLDVNLHSILQEGFLENTFAPWVESKGIGTFDWARAKEFEREYIAAQKNLQWFNSIKRLRDEKVVDQFLMSNALTQCFVLEEIGIDVVKQLDQWETTPTDIIAKQIGYTVE